MCSHIHRACQIHLLGRHMAQRQITDNSLIGQLHSRVHFKESYEGLLGGPGVVVVGEHHAFWGSGCARGVDDCAAFTREDGHGGEEGWGRRGKRSGDEFGPE